MKHIIILGDGMADEPIDILGGKTPLEIAETPAMDFLARNGRLGMLKTVPEGYHPGSEIANLGVLGYDVSKVFEGREDRALQGGRTNQNQRGGAGAAESGAQSLIRIRYIRLIRTSCVPDT